MKEIFMLAVLALINFGCGNNSVQFPQPPPLGNSFLRLDPLALNFCDNLHEGHVRNLEVDIEVLGYNGPNTPPSFMWTNLLNINNDPTTWTDIPINIPESGTFGILVRLVGTASDCFACCYGMIDPNINTTPCNSFQDGRVRFSGSDININAVPPPSNVFISPAFTTCYSCGC